MPSYLEDSRDVATPISLFSRQEFVDTVKLVHTELIQTSLQRSYLHNIDEEAVARLRRYALWLDEIVAIGRLDGAEAESATVLAANILEFVGCSQQTPETLSIFYPPLNDLIRSAIIGSLSPYKANSTLIATRILDVLGARAYDSPVEEFHNTVGRIVTAVLARQFQQAFHLSITLDELGQVAIQTLQDDGAAGNQAYFELDRVYAIGLACRKLASGMLIGAPSIVSSASDSFNTIEVSSKDSEDAEHLWLARRLRAVATEMYECSMHRVLGEHNVPVPFRRSLAASGIIELWRPQMKAVAAGVLDGKAGMNLVVSIPTGAGKTLIAELAIMGVLTKDRTSWAIYVTPSRSLVSQVSLDLRRHLRSMSIRVRNVVAGAEVNMFVNDEIEMIAESHSVTVMTPEKLEAYLRVDPEVFHSCGIVVFDEIHKISDSSRGALYESLVTRFRLLYPDTRVIVMSGVMSNSEEVAAWLGSERTATVIESRRPTRQIRGLAVRSTSKPRSPRAFRKTSRRRVDFRGGVVLVHEEDDLSGDLEVQLPDLFGGYFTEELMRWGWSENREAAKSSNLDHALGLTEVLVASPGTTLVFVGQTDWAESSCKKSTFDGYGQFVAERRRLSSFLANELGEDHFLVDTVTRGVAAHHARFPVAVQRALEYALENSWLKVIFATPTLREGLNTAATNVVLVGNSYYDEAAEESLPLQESDFENLAGRAGRPGRETEGRIFLVPDRLAQAQAVSTGRKYILVGDEALRARSQLRRLYQWLGEAKSDIRQLPGADQALLMGLRAVGLEGRDAVHSFFMHSLWSMQADEISEVYAAATSAADTLDRAEADVGTDRFLIAAKTGLALTSVESLRRRLDADAYRYEDPAELDLDWRSSLLPSLVDAALAVPEAGKVLAGSSDSWDAPTPWSANG